MGTINDLILLLKIIKNDGLGIIYKDFIIDAKSFQSNTTLKLPVMSLIMAMDIIYG